MSQQAAEFEKKRARVTAWLAERKADAVLLGSRANIDWLASGGEIGRPTVTSAAFLVSPSATAFLGPAAEIERIRQEELRGIDVEFVPVEGTGSDPLEQATRQRLGDGARVHTDLRHVAFLLDPEIETLRQPLVELEMERFRQLGQDAAAAVENVASECYPGIVERDVAARLAAECVRRRLVPVQLLVGADARAENYPRPTPKGAVAERRLGIGLVARRGGLHVGLARTVCLRTPDETFIARYRRAAASLAALMQASRAGARLGKVFAAAGLSETVRARAGGGIVGTRYPDLDARSRPASRVQPPQALAWWLHTEGIRCEDTVLVTQTGFELLTQSEGWPVHHHGNLEVSDLLAL